MHNFRHIVICHAKKVMDSQWTACRSRPAGSVDAVACSEYLPMPAASPQVNHFVGLPGLPRPGPHMTPLSGSQGHEVGITWAEQNFLKSNL